jgi:hypothetical protein
MTTPDPCAPASHVDSRNAPARQRPTAGAERARAMCMRDETNPTVRHRPATKRTGASCSARICETNRRRPACSETSPAAPTRRRRNEPETRRNSPFSALQPPPTGRSPSPWPGRQKEPVCRAVRARETNPTLTAMRATERIRRRSRAGDRTNPRPARIRHSRWRDDDRRAHRPARGLLPGGRTSQAPRGACPRDEPNAHRDARDRTNPTALTRQRQNEPEARTNPPFPVARRRSSGASPGP